MNGEQIAEARKGLRLSQSEFAAKIGVSRGAVHLWERGKGEPTRAHRKVLAALLGVDVETMNHTAPHAAALVNESAVVERVPLYRTLAYGSSPPWDFRLTGEIVDMVNAPSRLNGRKDLRAFQVATDVMVPRYFPGEMLWISRARMATEGDFVVVMRKNHDGNTSHSEDATLGRLTKLTASHVEVEQYKPAKRKRIARKDIEEIWRVVPMAEFG
jgi:transcriptional regulator with XRE-family HTH domain